MVAPNISIQAGSRPALQSDTEHGNITLMADLYDGQNVDLEYIPEQYRDLAEEAMRLADVYARRSLLDQAAATDHSLMVALAAGKSPVSPHQYSLTDSGNAERFAEMFRNELRYISEEKQWYAWNGKRWSVEIEPEKNKGDVLWRTKAVGKAILSEANALLSNGSERVDHVHKLMRWADTSLSSARRESMLKLAASEPDMKISVNSLDTHVWLLNCNNGTLDLKSGNLLPYCRNNFLTHLVPIDYDPHAKCPRWEQFLIEIFQSDSDLIHFFHKVVGYSLTGVTREECMFVLFGGGSNGKSTLLAILRELLGDLSHTATISTIAKKSDSNRNGGEDQAQLHGKRLVTCSEPERSIALDEELVKDLTSGKDRVRARLLYQNSFEFCPILKLFLACNHKPRIMGTDDGIWRRIRLIPFMMKFTGDKKDDTLEDKLKAELPGILTWAVQGCLAWQRESLKTCQTVENATIEYRTNSDVFGTFLEDCCRLEPDAKTTSIVLFNAYRMWCDENNYSPMTMKSFGDQLTDRSVGTCRLGGGVRARSGIKLIVAQSQQPQHQQRSSSRAW